MNDENTSRIEPRIVVEQKGMSKFFLFLFLVFSIAILFMVFTIMETVKKSDPEIVKWEYT